MRQSPHVLAIFALCLAAAPASALRTVSPEVIRGFAGTVEGKPVLAASRPRATNTPAAVTVAYNNTTSAANFGLSSTDLDAEWGDRTYLTGSGLLASHKFTIFNSDENVGGSLLTAQVGVDFYDGGTSTFIGGYVVDVDFGAGLPPSFYAIVDVPSLESSLIDLPPDVLVIQRVISYTGAANRLGIASLDPVTVGSSPVTMHIFASTIEGGIAGYYPVGSVPANPGYRVGLAQEPDGTVSQTWGQLKKRFK